MTTTAQEILVPPQADIMRIVFLYVAQGESTLVFIPWNGVHRTMLIDSNQGRKHGGINLVDLLRDLFEGQQSGSLSYFVNTHPHGDHAGGLDEIEDSVEIDNVWHSGHNPGKDHEEAYRAIERLRQKVSKKGGEDRILTGSRSIEKLGDAVYNVLSPAQYVQDDIAGEECEVRYRRIHEHCAVLRIGYGSPTPTYVLITGDSDKCAWSEHITEYHGAGDENRIQAQILSASHHGSRTFFKTCEEDPDPYTKHLELIAPAHLIISKVVTAIRTTTHLNSTRGTLRRRRYSTLVTVDVPSSAIFTLTANTTSMMMAGDWQRYMGSRQMMKGAVAPARPNHGPSEVPM